ncbi:cold shock domain-containing protein [Pseudomonas sp. R3-18-08]|uniref:cold shock domain-containing protein n=1 Tax=Pseudomonas sp. R3-18-08 TaxID=1173283 RepID=UPI000F588833|nr:cold shock domain-containing protein [Pseudomonas sp. R3-18-08]
MAKSTGTVKCFSVDEGSGFIAHSSGVPDIFFQLSSIKNQDIPSLSTGQRVEYEVKVGQKGLQADEVWVL